MGVVLVNLGCGTSGTSGTEFPRRYFVSLLCWCGAGAISFVRSCYLTFLGSTVVFAFTFSRIVEYGCVVYP